MRTTTLLSLGHFGRLTLALLVWGGVAPLRAANPNDPYPPIVSLGNDTYLITRGATFYYFRNTAKLVTRARADAVKFCHDMNREMKELSVEEIKAGLIIGDFAKARIKFQALLPGDPALAGARPQPAVNAPAPVVLTVPPETASDLTKLDELHRSGVVNDAEFAAAKKRLSERSLEELHSKGVLSDEEYAAARRRLNEH